jgi:hypothetical protein
MAESHESKLDELYQLPLDEFTKARNALAKTLSGDSKRIAASLTKPTLPIWAINQLYWKDRSTYKALIDAAEKLRAAHRAVLGGKKIDLRKPDEVHRAALERAAAKTAGLLHAAAGRVSEPVRETIRRALATLPSDEQAGRLTREPEPAGFSLFAGVKPRPAKVSSPHRPPDRTATVEKRNEATERRDTERERQKVELARQKAARAREKALTAARKDLKDAQQTAERATFVLRKAESELSKAQASETKAASQLKEAARRLAELERD